ncbi:MAG: sortase [bacterium]|nr:sortase [bacterium]
MKFTTLSEMGHMFFRHPNKQKYWKIFVIRTIGNVLIIGSILFVLSQFYPVIAAEVTYRVDRISGVNQYDESDYVERESSPSLNSPELSSPSPIPAITPKPLPETDIIPESKEFGIVIPKIKANAVVVANVDPFVPSTYDQALKKGVAHARDSVFPGENGSVYLFAHNTLNAWEIPKYNAVFFLLHNLDPGDRIITYYNNIRYDYIVFDKQVHSAKDLSPLTTQYSEPILSLQTCWPPGTTWQRMVVRAKLDI